MKFCVTGKRGYIGRHVCAELLKRGHEETDVDFEAVIHLAWRGLPHYTSTVHYENVYHQVERLRAIVASGVTNITVAGTCLEAVPKPPHYAKAKLAILEELQKLPCALKWVRLFNVWGGEGERPERLVPQLRRAIAMGLPKFSVIDGERQFMRVETTAWYLVQIAEQVAVTDIIDCCSDEPRAVADFCAEYKQMSPIEIVKDYPRPPYEPRVMSGSSAKLLRCIRR